MCAFYYLHDFLVQVLVVLQRTSSAWNINYILFLSACFILYCIVHSVLRNRIYNLPPGPAPLPILGNLIHVDSEKPERTLMQWKKKYGSVYTIWFGSDPAIVLTGYEELYQTLIKDGENFSGRPGGILTQDLYKAALGKQVRLGIGNLQQWMWHEQRRCVLSWMHNMGFGRPNSQVIIISEELAILKEEILSSLNANSVITLDMAVPLLTCFGHIRSVLLFGHRVDPSLFDEIEQFMHDFNVPIAPFNIQEVLRRCNPWLRHFPILGHFGWDELKRQYDVLHKHIQPEIDMIKKIVAELKEYPDCFTFRYLKDLQNKQSENEGELGYYSELQLFAILVALWTSMETITAAVLWTIYFLSQNEDIQEKVKAEIDSVLEKGQTLKYEHRKQMIYTQAVIAEALRLGDVVPINLLHSTLEDTEIVGYKIPKGTIILPQISVSHYDPDIFPDPHSFRPEHFLTDDGQFRKVKQFKPFSLGKRECPGQTISVQEHFLATVLLFQNFKFVFLGDSTNGKMQPGLSHHPKPFLVKITKR